MGNASEFKILNLKFSHKKAEAVPVYIGKGIGSSVPLKFKSFSRIAVLMDENVAHHWGANLQKQAGEKDLLIVIPAGEEHKNLETVHDIWAALLKYKFDRKSVLINIGGGVVCDMGAFAAATYMRGISFVQVPTTLLAMADAAIGGKTGINFGGLKNSIGLFAQPLVVICDSEFLSTLPERELRSGFAEIIKHSLIADVKLFRNLSESNITGLHGKKLEQVLYKSCEIKCRVVSADVNEQGKRKILNFGHTVGHAIEMASQDTSKPLLHGEAIAVGMVAEAKLSCLAGLLGAGELVKIEKAIASAKLPLKASKKLVNQVLAKIKQDKKNEREKIKWVLLKEIGNAVFDIEQPRHLIKQAIEYVLE